MTAGDLQKCLARNRIPASATLMSDSGWECGPTRMDGLYYNKTTNTVVFTQYFGQHEDDDYCSSPDWKELH